MDTLSPELSSQTTESSSQLKPPSSAPIEISNAEPQQEIETVMSFNFYGNFLENQRSVSSPASPKPQKNRKSSKLVDKNSEQPSVRVVYAQSGISKPDNDDFSAILEPIFQQYENNKENESELNASITREEREWRNESQLITEAIQEIIDSWRVYQRHRFENTKLERKELLRNFVLIFCQNFDVNTNLHKLLPYYLNLNFMSIDEMVNTLSFDYCDYFSDIYLQNGQLNYQILNNFLFEKDVDAELPFGILLLKVLSILTASGFHVNIVNGLPLAIAKTLFLLSTHFSNSKPSATLNSEEIDEEDQFSGEDTDEEDSSIWHISVLSKVQEQLNFYIFKNQQDLETYNMFVNSNFEFTSQNKSSQNSSATKLDSFAEDDISILSSVTVLLNEYVGYEMNDDFSIKEKVPIVIVAHLLKNISFSNTTFVKLFIDSKDWKLICHSLLQISLQTKLRTKDFIHFANLITFGFGKMFQTASRDLIRLQEGIAKHKVISQLVQLINDQLQLLDQRKAFPLYRVALTYLNEICVFCLFTSLHVIPGVLMQFETADGYDTMTALFENINRDVNQKHVDWQLLIFEQQKMLKVFYILLHLSVDLTKFIQTIRIYKPAANNNNSSFASSLRRRSLFKLLQQQQQSNEKEVNLFECPHNPKVFEKLLFLFDHTEMVQYNKSEMDSDLDRLPFHFCCKRELLFTICDLLHFHVEEYCQVLYEKNPFQVLAQNYIRVGPKLQQLILKTFELYMGLFCNSSMKELMETKALFSTHSLFVLLQRDVGHYFKLLHQFDHSTHLQSIVRICKHCKRILQSKYKSKIQTLFRHAGLIDNILQVFMYPNSKRNTIVVVELLEILFLFLEQNSDNHTSILNTINSMQVLYSLLFDDALLSHTLKIIQQLVITDKSQKYKFIVADLIDILFTHSSQHQQIRLPMRNAMIQSLIGMMHDNPNVKHSFRSAQGFECIAHNLSLLVKEKYPTYEMEIMIQKEYSMTIAIRHEIESSDTRDIEMIFVVSQSLLALLNKTLTENARNQTYFREKLAFKSLLEALHQLQFMCDYATGLQWCMSLIQLSVMSDSLYQTSKTESDFLQQLQQQVVIVWNPEVISDILLPLLAHQQFNSDDTIQLLQFVISSVKLLSVKWVTNRHKLCFAGTVKSILNGFKDILLDSSHSLQESLIQLLYVLTRHSFDTFDMQTFFTFFRTGHVPDNLLQLLNQLAKEEEYIPNYYMDFLPLPFSRSERENKQYSKAAKKRSKKLAFEGTNAAIVLPKMTYSPWPSNLGNSLLLWFRIENHMSNSDICLASMSSSKGEFQLDCCVDRSMQIKLVVNDKRCKQSHEVIFDSCILDHNKWYCMVLQHSQHITNQKVVHQFSLSLNGFLMRKKIFDYTDSTLFHVIKTLLHMGTYKLTHVIFGNVITSFSRKFASFPLHSFSLGNAYFLEGLLLESEVYLLYHLGPNYVGYFHEDLQHYFSNEILNEQSVTTFRQEELNEWKQTSGAVNHVLNRLEDKVIFVFSARDATVAMKLSIHVMSNINFYDLQNQSNSSSATNTNSSNNSNTSASNGMLLSNSLPSHTFDLSSPNSPNPNLHHTIASNHTTLTKQWMEHVHVMNASQLQQQLQQERTNAIVPANGEESLIVSKTTATEFCPIACHLFGPVELITKWTLKSNLPSIGGMSAMIALLGVIPSASQRIIVLQLIAYLIQFQPQNLKELQQIDGYDLLNHICLQQQFLMNDQILYALFILCGLQLENDRVKGIICNYVALEKLIMDYKIWRQSPLRTQKLLFEHLAQLVTVSPFKWHHIHVYRSVGVLKRFMYTLSQCNLLQIPFALDLMSSIIQSIQSILAIPLTMNQLFPIYRYLIITHPQKYHHHKSKSHHSPLQLSKEENQLLIWEEQMAEPRNAILHFLHCLLKQCTESFVDEFSGNAVLYWKKLLCLLDHKSHITRTILLQILGVYMIRLPLFYDSFVKQLGMESLSNQLKQFEPYLSEFQVLFDLLLGQNDSFIAKNVMAESTTPLSAMSSGSTSIVSKKSSFVSSVASAFSREEHYDLHHNSFVLDSDALYHVSSKYDVTTLQVQPVESFQFVELLKVIFNLIPCLTSPSTKIHLIDTLFLLFKEGGSNAKQSFLQFDIHRHLLFLLGVKIVQENETLLISICKFMVEYMNVAIHCKEVGSQKKTGVECLNDILEGLFLLEGYSIAAIHNLQRFILHGVLNHFLPVVLKSLPYNTSQQSSSSTNVLGKNWETQFARFCAIAMDHVLNWGTGKVKQQQQQQQQQFFGHNLDDSQTTSPLSSNPSFSKSRTMGDLFDKTTSRKLSILGSTPSFVALDQLANNTFQFNLDSANLNSNSQQKDWQLTAKQWLQMEWEDMSKSNNNNNSKQAETYFQYTHYQMEGFVFWLMDSIAKCLKQVSKFGAMSLPAVILTDQLKRTCLFLLEARKSTEEQLFALLYLLHFDPQQQQTEEEEQSPSYKASAMLISGGTDKLAGQDDEQFTTRLLLCVVKLFTKYHEPLLIHVCKKLIVAVLKLQRNYFRKIFHSGMLQNIDNLLNMLEQSSMRLTEEEECNYYVIIPAINETVKLWENRETTDNKAKLSKILMQLSDLISKEQELDQNRIRQFYEASNELTTVQHNFIAPFYVEMKQNENRNLIAAKKWRRLLKRLADEKSILYAFTQPISFKYMSSQNYIYRPYDSNTFYETEWKLDPTHGPHRVRIRLKHSKYIGLAHWKEEELSLMHSENSSNSNPSNSATNSNTTASNSGASTSKTNPFSVEQSHSSFITDSTGQDTVILQPKPCTRITPLRKYEGEAMLYQSGLHFAGFEQSHNSKVMIEDLNPSRKVFSYSFESIKEIHMRRYLQRNCAMEIFFIDGKSIFLAFKETKDRDEIHFCLTKSHPQTLVLPNLVTYDEETSATGFLFTKKSMTQKWQEGSISNFEYLMHLNTIAGRSFNDLTQYPVFPFIIADYESENLDLFNPSVYRDLTKPMGAQNENRVQKADAQYRDLEESGNIPYHWGTHYSTPVAVLFYLLRLEPYTRCFWELNGQKLDLADRTFHSIKNAWNASSGKFGQKSDVKELIPEFFYLPEFLVNKNHIDLGTMQNETRVDQVELPTWAHGSMITFIRKHREALESAYVSANLHHWIDLIFGFKQTGKEAVAAFNVFHYLTYEGGNEDIDSLDEVLREARWTQICNYGQTPKQLFTKPHPPKVVLNKLDLMFIYTNPQYLKCMQVRIFKESVGDLYVGEDEKSVLALGRDRIFIPTTKSPLLYLSYSHWDRTLRINKLDASKPVFSLKWIRSEQFVVAKFSEDGKTLALGCDSSVVHLFKYNEKKAKKTGKYLEHTATLSGHSYRVISVHVSSSHNIVLSGSEDKCLIIWDLNRLCFIRSIEHDGPVSAVTVSPTTGDIASFCTNAKKEHILYLRTINGDLISKCNLEARATCLLFTWAPEGVFRNVLAVGLENGKVCILDAVELYIICTLSIATPTYQSAPITSLTMSGNMTDLITGDENGIVVTYSVIKENKKLFVSTEFD